jgi:hypothetical protein
MKRPLMKKDATPRTLRGSTRRPPMKNETTSEMQLCTIESSY